MNRPTSRNEHRPLTRPPGRGRAVPLALAALAGLLVLAALTAPTTAGDGTEDSPGGRPAMGGDRSPVAFEGIVEPRRRGLVRFLRKLTGERSTVRSFRRPYGVTWDGDELLVTDPGAGRVLRLSAKGRIRAVLDRRMESPIGVAVCSPGVIVADSRAGTLLVLDRELRRRRVLAQGLQRPTGVACRGREIFVAETAAHRIAVVTPEGPSRTFGRRGDGDGELNFPTSLALDDRGLWVGDTLNFRLQRLDPATGEALASFGRLGDAPGDMPRVKGVAVDALDRLWITDAHLDQVALYRPDGTFLSYLGHPGTRPREFSFPAGLAAHPDGRVAVVDSLNRRLQIFRSLPRSAP